MKEEVNNIDSMTEEELFYEYKRTGDKALRDAIINRYLYIAEIIAKKFLNRGVEYDDIYQVACLGIMHAVDRYDVTKGIKFSSFATPTIIGDIKRYFRDKANIIRIPRRIYEIYQKVNQAKDELTQSLGRAPKVEEIASHLNIPEETILEVIESDNVNAVQSLEQSAYSDDDIALYNVVGEEDSSFVKIENRDFIEKSINMLNDAEKEFVKQRYFKNKTQKQIADMMGVSQMYISRLEKKILKKFKMMYQKSVN